MSRSLVIMGPSGNGKSSLGAALAGRLGWTFIEGDDHHPPANLAKMARGEALNDEDRAPFLASVGRALVAYPAGAVAACSALKRDYRDMLREIAGDVLFILPQLSRDALEQRMERRSGHFMPASLLDSQLAALETPGAGEHALTVDGELDLDAQVDAILAHLRLTAG